MISLAMRGNLCIATELNPLKGDRFSVSIAADGRIFLAVGNDKYEITSSYSYPGEKIGYHRLGTANREKSAWLLKHETSGPNTTQVHAAGKHYALRRTIAVTKNQIDVCDTITNTIDKDVGILIRHEVIPSAQPEEIRLCGVPAEVGSWAENPTLFFRSEGSALGVMAVDNISRVQFFATATDIAGAFGLRNMALRPGKSVSLRWSLYPLAAGENYFTFINHLREVLGVNQTIPGPGGWFDATKAPLWQAWQDPKPLRETLDRNQLKVVLLSPWLDYENIHRQTKQLIWRDEYVPLMKQSIEVLHKIDPEIQVMACLEAPFVGLPDTLVDDLYQVVPDPKKQGYYDMTDQMVEVFEQHPQSWQRWQDSLVYNEDGLTKFELYYREGLPLIALTVRPIAGNGQHAFLMDQARFVIEEAGFDGYYIDSFTGAQHWYYGYSYDRWDGITIDISSETGKIVRRFTDLALAGTTSRKEVIEYGVSRGRLVLVNGHPITEDTQSLGHLSFNESEWAFEPLEWMGEKPPYVQRPCEAHLSTPLALGFRPLRHGDQGKANYAQIVNKGAIAFLRHGVLYFHYSMEIPATGPGSGEYGPFNHMFPITPTHLGEGFVEGKERVVTCVSKTFQWSLPRKPKILLFDEAGRKIGHTMQVGKTTAGWSVPVELNDWQQIAVIE